MYGEGQPQILGPRDKNFLGKIQPKIKLFSKHLPELVILDSDLPGLDGIFLIREMSQLDSSVKIIFTTSGVSTNALKIISKFSNLVILYKPFDSKMFLEKLDELKF